MRIISKFKDYYDYLQGIYGVDHLLVLDRTKFTSSPIVPKDYDIVNLYVCDYHIQGMWMNGKVLYGDELIKYGDKQRYRWESKPKYDKPDSKIHITHPHIKYASYSDRYIYLKPQLLPRDKSPNRKRKCPILIRTYDKVYDVFPILKQFGVERIFPAEKMWMMLSEWLSSEREEPRVDTQTDKEKIKSHGFDIKISFRKIK